jgi:DNA-binding IclR family transcriptional regulator
MTGAELREDFARISDRRYATDEEEHREGVCCLAVPLDSDGAQIVAIAAPAERFRANFESLLEGLRSAASRFYLQ